MPKKGKGKKKGGKKSKKQKAAELAELQRLEEERLRLEEEERKRKIEEERIRQEEEAKKQERIAKKRAEDSERLGKEIEEDGGSEKDRNEKILSHIGDVDDSEEWAKVVNCDPLPDPSDEPDFNSYLTLWKEDDDAGDGVLQKIANAEVIMCSLDVLAASARQEVNEAQVRWCLGKSTEVFDILHEKVDTFTANQLVAADESGKMVRSSIIMEKDLDSIKFALWTSGHTKLKRTKILDFSELGVTIDLPSTITMQNKNGMAVRVTYTAHDPFEQQNTSNLCSYGGIYCIDALELPLPASPLQDWIVRDLNDAFEDVQIRPYPGNTESAAVVQPVKITWMVPDTILIDDHPSVGWWDADTKAWSIQGIEEIKFDTEDRVISLHTPVLRPLALLHPKKLDFPYSSWIIEPTATNCAIIQVVGSRLTVELQVENEHCKLVSPQAPELNHLMVPMKPNVLLWELHRSGINLLVNSDDSSKLGLQTKTSAVENFFHQQISRIVAGFSVGKSSWNEKLDSDSAVFRIKASNAPEDAPWQVVGGTADKMYLSKHTEDPAETWDNEEPEGEEHQVHTTLKRAVEPLCGEAHKLAIETSSIFFEETMRKTLNLIRLFTH